MLTTLVIGHYSSPISISIIRCFLDRGGRGAQLSSMGMKVANKLILKYLKLDCWHLLSPQFSTTASIPLSEKKTFHQMMASFSRLTYFHFSISL